MNDTIEMVYTQCANWLTDWLEGGRPILMDEWDLSSWMNNEMNEATACFLEYGFKSPRARNDVLMILRALYYEYFLLQQANHIRSLTPNISSVSRLMNLPQTTQKSGSWHTESRDLLTAHEFGAVCYSTPGKRSLVLAKKCGHVVAADETLDAKQSQTVFLSSEDGTLSALKWGWRYEPVVRDLFERCVAEGTVYDGLGRIRHPSLPRLAASPDGLITTGPRCGRLVEIKSPITRKLTGEVPLDYYCQMQLQAEVCDVDAVEYVECRCETFNPANVDFAVLSASKIPWIGKICVVAASVDVLPTDYEYIYSPLFPNTQDGLRDCVAWSPPSACIVHEMSYWFVRDWFAKTVLRNRRWWAEIAYPSYVEFWREVEEARTSGRFNSQALFVDTSTVCSRRSEIEAEEAESDHAENDAEDDVGDCTSDEDLETVATVAGEWQGVE